MPYKTVLWISVVIFFLAVCVGFSEIIYVDEAVSSAGSWYVAADDPEGEEKDIGTSVSSEGFWYKIDVPGPSPRHSPGMFYDSARGVVVLFGGLDGGNSPDSNITGRYLGMGRSRVEAGFGERALTADGARNGLR